MMNGGEGEQSLRGQCRRLCGSPEQGDILWNRLNDVFDCLPVAAVIDGELFCAHGGVPQSRTSLLLEGSMMWGATPGGVRVTIADRTTSRTASTC